MSFPCETLESFVRAVEAASVSPKEAFKVVKKSSRESFIQCSHVSLASWFEAQISADPPFMYERIKRIDSLSE